MGQTVVRLEWALPESVLGVVVQDETAAAEEVKKAAVLDWVRMQKLSWRKGAELLGMSYRDFLALMVEHRVPSLDYIGGVAG